MSIEPNEQTGSAAWHKTIEANRERPLLAQHEVMKPNYPPYIEDT